jgi:hypothetical protein
MNEEDMCVDMGVISGFNVSTGYDKDKGLICTVKYKAHLAASDIAQMLDAGKTTSLRAKIFTQALPVLLDRQGDQLGLAAAIDSGVLQVRDCKVVEAGKETATLEAVLESGRTGEGPANPRKEPTEELEPSSEGETDWSKPHRYMKALGEGAPRGVCRCGQKKSHGIHTDRGSVANG